MVKHFIWLHSLLRVDLQGLSQKRTGSVGQRGRYQTLDRDCFELGLELRLSAAGPGSGAREHFIEDDPDCPYIALVTVLVAVESLGGHVDRRAK